MNYLKRYLQVSKRWTGMIILFGKKIHPGHFCSNFPLLSNIQEISLHLLIYDVNISLPEIMKNSSRLLYSSHGIYLKLRCNKHYNFHSPAENLLVNSLSLQPLSQSKGQKIFTVPKLLIVMLNGSTLKEAPCFECQLGLKLTPDLN